MRLVIFGGRTYRDVAQLAQIMRDRVRPDVVISGMADGADTLGRTWAHSHHVQVVEVPALWDTYGKRAGFLRNEVMADLSTHGLAFWNGRSRGTSMMIDLMLERDRDLQIVRY